MMGVTKCRVHGATPPPQHHLHDQLVDTCEVLLLLFHLLINIVHLGPVNADSFPIYSLSDNANSLRVRAVKEGGEPMVVDGLEQGIVARLWSWEGADRQHPDLTGKRVSLPKLEVRVQEYERVVG